MDQIIQDMGIADAHNNDDSMLLMINNSAFGELDSNNVSRQMSAMNIHQQSSFDGNPAAVASVAALGVQEVDIEDLNHEAAEGGQ